MQSRKRSRFGVREQSIANSVRHVGTQLTFSLAAGDRRQYLGDCQFRNHQSDLAAQIRIDPIAIDLRNVQFCQGASVDVERDLRG